MELAQGIDSQSRRARITIWLLWGCLALAAAGVASGVAQHLLLARAAAGVIGNEEAQANDLRVQAIAGLQVLALLASGVAWLGWSRRAWENLLLLGTRQVSTSPGWVAGWWFVPFANLVKPYRVTKELWLRSRDDNTQASVEGLAGPGLLDAWWGAWIVMGVMGRVVAGFAERAKGLSELETVTWLGIASDVVTALAAWAALTIVGQIDAHQKAAGARATAASVFE